MSRWGGVSLRAKPKEAVRRNPQRREGSDAKRRNKDRPLRSHRRTRRWWDGRGLSRTGHQVEPRRRLKGPARGLRSRSRTHGTLPARSAGARLAESSQHRLHLWAGRVGRGAGPGDGAGGRGLTEGAYCKTPYPRPLSPRERGEREWFPHSLGERVSRFYRDG